MQRHPASSMCNFARTGRARRTRRRCGRLRRERVRSGDTSVTIRSAATVETDFAILTRGHAAQTRCVVVLSSDAGSASGAARRRTVSNAVGASWAWSSDTLCAVRSGAACPADAARLRVGLGRCRAVGAVDARADVGCGQGRIVRAGDAADATASARAPAKERKRATESASCKN
jgi:hypothetical protein